MLSTDSEEPLYYSEGQYQATAKAFTKIIAPLCRAVHADLLKQGFKGEEFSTSMDEKFIEHAATPSIKFRGGISSLAFKYDALKGGTQVKEVIYSPAKSPLQAARDAPVLL